VRCRVFPSVARSCASCKDPLTGGLSLDAIPDRVTWAHRRRTAVFGSGRLGKAISLYLINKEKAEDRPGRIIVTNRSAARLAKLQEMVKRLETDITLSISRTIARQATTKSWQGCRWQCCHQRYRIGERHPRLSRDRRRSIPAQWYCLEINYRAIWISGIRRWLRRKPESGR